MSTKATQNWYHRPYLDEGALNQRKKLPEISHQVTVSLHLAGISTNEARSE